MNEEAQPVTVPTRPRKRKASVPRKPRVVDPAITAKVKAYRDSLLKSSKRLATILKLVPLLTQEDRNKLADALRYLTTPSPIQP